MKETKLQTNQLDVISNNNGLSMYLSGLLSGRKATPRSSLYNIKAKTKVLSPDEILSHWTATLESLTSGNSFEREVFQFDSAQLQKWGPQGEIAPIAKLLEDVVYPSFAEQDTPEAFSTSDWMEAKRRVVRTLHACGCRGLAPVPYHRVVDDMRARDTLESNSGWPLFTRRSKPDVVKQSIEEAVSGEWETYPAIALFRNYNLKTRLVWMFPMSANLVEGSFFQPLQSILMKSFAGEQFLAPWMGFEHVRSIVSNVYDSGGVVAASDFSSTDAHFKLATSLEVADVLEQCFQPRFRAQLRHSITHMHTIPLIISPDTELVGEHGVSSGSNWTNFIETMFDWILAIYVSLQEGASPSSRWGISSIYSGLYAIGDDMSWCVDKHHYDPDFSDRLAAYGKQVGQEIKAEKTTNDRDKVKSLQRLFQAGYRNDQGQLRAVYPTIRALKSLVYPERMHKKALWSRDMSAVRAFMILENTVDHPLFQQFCKFVADGDPYLSEFARKSSGYKQTALRKSQLIPGLNSTYNQEKRDLSFSEFASINFVATL